MDIYLTYPSIKDSQLLSRSRSRSPINAPQIYIIGIFGSRKNMNETDLYETILNPVLSELGRMPEKILMPADNNATSIYLEDWAKHLKIPLQAFQADFHSQGKRATILRDGRIERECTVAIVFQAPRSTRYNTLAERMVKHGKRVFFIDINGDLVELTN